MPRGFGVLFAAVTYAASCETERTPSRMGSEPIYRRRVTNLALVFDWRAAKSVSRRFTHALLPSKPN